MKKVLLLAAVAGLVSFTSCKKEANAVADGVENAADATVEAAGDAVDATGDAIEGVADATGDAVEGAVEGVEQMIKGTPNFESTELQEWANNLHDAAGKAYNSAKEGDVTALGEAQTTITSLAESLTNFKDNPEFAKAQEYYNSVKSVLENM